MRSLKGLNIRHTRSKKLYNEVSLLKGKAMKNLKINSSFKSELGHSVGMGRVAFSQAALSEFHLLKAIA